MKGLISRNIINDKRKTTFKHFLRFLKENGLYHEYFRILRLKPDGEYRRLYYGDEIQFFNKCSIEKWTTSCFVWGEYDKCGKINWCGLHEKWQLKVVYEI